MADPLPQSRYGSIVTYRWFGDGYMMIGFSEGYLVVISTHMKEIGEELFSGWFHKVQWQTHTRAPPFVPPASPQTHHRHPPPKHLQDRLDDIAFSPIMQRAATAGTNHIKMVDMTDWKEVKEEATSIDRAHGPIDKLAWTSDGQILTASTRTGVLYNFLARMPTIHDTHDTRGSRSSHAATRSCGVHWIGYAAARALSCAGIAAGIENEVFQTPPAKLAGTWSEEIGMAW